MKLNARLAMIAGRIPNCRILSDIGTDHAYIPIYALENRLCDKSLAADLREGPLVMARTNIKRHGLEKQIETRLGNGLEPISPDECDVVVIAGMGGSLIRDILSTSVEKSKKARLLLLQPNNAADVLRKWLYENGFDITDESLALDAGKLYCMICAKWSGMTAEREEFDFYIGNMLLQSGDPLLHRYIEKKIKELDVIISGRSKASKKDNRKIDRRDGRGISGVADGISLISRMTAEQCQDIRNRLKAFLIRQKV